MTNAVSIAQSGSNNVTFRNRIINGAMIIDQRNAGASVTPSASTYTLDRWFCSFSQASKLTIQQNYGTVTPPAGFTNYLGIKVAATATVGSTDYFEVYQRIEGFNVADLGWGTVNAKTVTLSAWVYSNTTGTFGGALRNSAGDRSYPFTYSIPVANTWTQISVTIAGDTSGTWLTNNGSGVLITFSVGTGSTYLGTAGSWAATVYGGATGQNSLMGSTSNYLYITGVQLEAGTTASPFEYRQYGTELALCQRYCHGFTATALGVNYNGNYCLSGLSLGTTMRASPTLKSGSSFPATGGTPSANIIGPDSVFIYNTSNSWGAFGSVGVTFTGVFEAEL